MAVLLSTITPATKADIRVKKKEKKKERKERKKKNCYFVFFWPAYVDELPFFIGNKEKKAQEPKSMKGINKESCCQPSAKVGRHQSQKGCPTTSADPQPA